MNCQKQKSSLSFETALQRTEDLQQDCQLPVSVAARNGHKNRASDARAEGECATSASLTGCVPDTQIRSTLEGIRPMHSDLMRPPIRVDLVGIDARARERFETVFRDRGQGAYLVVNSTVAEVAIIDLDNPEGNTFWHRYCFQFPNRPVILLSNTNPSLDRGEKFLRKPIQVDALLAVLEEIRHRLEILDVNVSSRVKRELAADVEPGTIKITERSALFPSGCAPRRGESCTALSDPAEESKSSDESNTSCLQNLRGVGGTGGNDSAKSFSVSSEHLAQATAQPSTLPQLLAEEFTHPESKSEKTYRYPQSRRHSIHPADSAFQEQPNVAANCAPTDRNPGEPLDDLECWEKTSHLSSCPAAQPQTGFLAVHDRLLGLLQVALQESTSSQHAVELTLQNGHLVVHAPRGRIHYAFTDDQLKQLATRVFLATQTRIRPCGADVCDPYLTSATPASAWETVEAFLWKLALWTYRDCLPLGTHLEKRVYLRHWPNLTRLHPVPDAMRIASLWNEQPMTLGYTAKALGIPQQHVFNFYCASHTIGLTGQARREADYLFQEAATHSKGKRGFVSAMMKRLRFSANS